MNKANKPKGAKRPKLRELPQIRERISFLYLERCVINRQDSALTVTDGRGTVFVPISALGLLMLGPGTSISHRAIELIGDSGISVVWTGERGVRYYAHGRPLTHSSRLLVAQAALVSNSKSRLIVARKMYSMRFPNEDVATLTMQQLRGKEGARIRAVYREASRETGVKWNGREYDPDDFYASDLVNMALSAAHACLYGVAHSAIVALGCSPGLGFVHTGHERSFVYDIADLYKAEVTIPIAFKVAASFNEQDIGQGTRRAVRDVIFEKRVLERMVKDIQTLLLTNADDERIDANVIYLWDEKVGFVNNATSYYEEWSDELENGYGRIIKDEC